MNIDSRNAETWTVMSQTTPSERLLLTFLSIFTIISRRRAA